MKLGELRGDELRNWRKKRGWSGKYFAHKLGISVVTLWKYEKAERVPHWVEVECMGLGFNA